MGLLALIVIKIFYEGDVFLDTQFRSPSWTRFPDHLRLLISSLAEMHGHGIEAIRICPLHFRCTCLMFNYVRNAGRELTQKKRTYLVLRCCVNDVFTFLYVSTNYRYLLCGFLHTKEFAIPTSTPTIHAPWQLVGV